MRNKKLQTNRVHNEYGLPISYLKKQLEVFEKMHPDAYVVMNQRDGCLDLYKVEIKEFQEVCKYLCQILWE